MRAELRELWRFRELLWSLVERELKIRYKNSVLGFLWSLINPMVTAIVMTLVFRLFLNQDVPSYGLYVLSAYLPFLFFQFALMDSSQSILLAMPMVRKVYFPREVLPLAQILANFIHLLLALGVFVAIAVAVWLRHPGDFPIKATVVWLPAILLVNLCLATGLGLIVSALNTFYEDVKYILGALLYMLFFVSPVMYFSETVYYQTHHGATANGGLIYTLYHLNPVAMLCTAYRKAWLAPVDIPVGPKIAGQNQIKQAALQMDWGLFLIAAGVSIGVLILGYHVFNRMKWRFVERP